MSTDSMTNQPEPYTGRRYDGEAITTWVKSQIAYAVSTFPKDTEDMLRLYLTTCFRQLIFQNVIFAARIDIEWRDGRMHQIHCWISGLNASLAFEQLSYNLETNL